MNLYYSKGVTAVRVEITDKIRISTVTIKKKEKKTVKSYGSATKSGPFLMHGITWFVPGVTRRLSLVKQELLTLPEFTPGF